MCYTHPFIFLKMSSYSAVVRVNLWKANKTNNVPDDIIWQWIYLFRIAPWDESSHFVQCPGNMIVQITGADKGTKVAELSRSSFSTIATHVSSDVVTEKQIKLFTNLLKVLNMYISIFLGTFLTLNENHLPCDIQQKGCHFQENK